MSDQLSKRYLHTGAAPVSPCASIQAQAAPREYPAIESATTPAEVGVVAWFIDDGTTKSFTTRQIDADLWGKEPGYTITPLVPAAAVATLARQLAEKTKLADDVYEMLSAQLTEAFAEKVDQRIRAEQAESQLAEATRRLGEVEGLLREAAGHMKRGRAYYSEYHDFIERITALTKEPTK